MTASSRSLAVALITCLALLGCENSKPVDRPQPTEKELAKRRFEHIVAEIKHRIDNRRSRGPSTIAGTTVRLTTTVEEELVPPEADGLAWRGKVIVVTKSNVTVIATPTEEENSDTANSRSDNSAESTSEEDELEATLAQLAEARDGASRSQTPSMQVIDGSKVEAYELIYEDGNWRLTTPIEKETEMGVIFGAALKSQRAGG